MYLTFAPLLELSKATVASLKDKTKLEITNIGTSPIASHDQFGHAFIVLPNIPAEAGKRDTLKDFLVRCHALQSKEITRGDKSELKYLQVDGLKRVCTIADAFVGSVVGHLVSTVAAVGMPDFPKFERKRLQDILA